MSKWLNDGEVLVGEGSGEALPVSPRQRGLPAGSPRPSRVHSPLASHREMAPGSPKVETMDTAKELFVLCDKEGKGFITKRDMQRLQEELPLSPEQLETVFESLDRESNGFLTPAEFKTGLGELVGLEDSTERSQEEAKKHMDQVDWSQDAAAVRFVNIVRELGADKLFHNQQELCCTWCELQRDQPELLGVLEGVLVHAVSNLQDSNRERDSLEQALRRRDIEHDQVVRSIYEEMENQMREEREKRLSQDGSKQKQKQLEEELKLREQELEKVLTKQKELMTRIQQLSCEQTNVKEQNQQLQRLNVQLQEQVESSREQLQATTAQLGLLQLSTAQEQAAKQRNVTKVSRNMQKEKDSLLRQLELLRDMNKRLRDEKDAQQSQRRNPNVTKTAEERVSHTVSNVLQDKPLKRQLSSFDELEQDREVTMRHQLSRRVGCENVEQTQIQYISGKSSFIRQKCTGSFYDKMSSTAGKARCFLKVPLITEQYYCRVGGVLTMYDITHSTSFTAVRGWVASVKEKMSEGAVLMLPGNKLDLATAEEGKRLADQHQAVFYKCSARTGCNVEDLMTHLSQMLVTQNDQQWEESGLQRFLTGDTAKRSCCT